VQQPRFESKTVLKKKFSWKNYPELERFLIANRDDYLRHSSKNYTLEQKTYNNWLTEQLLQLAEKNHYNFDPEDFNFVAIRDRIRCYYKSYVQTARKRGLPLPKSPGGSNNGDALEHAGGHDGEDDEDDGKDADDNEKEVDEQGDTKMHLNDENAEDGKKENTKANSQQREEKLKGSDSMDLDDHLSVEKKQKILDFKPPQPKPDSLLKKSAAE